MVLGAAMPSSTKSKILSSSLSSRSSNDGGGNWGMGFLFVFFHHNNNNPTPGCQQRRLSLSLSNTNSNSKSSTITNSHLLSKAQSTLSICALLFFTTLLLFSLFPPSLHHHHHSTTTRRILRHQPTSPLIFPRPCKVWGPSSVMPRAMTDLLVGHVPEGVSERGIQTFLRLMHHSGLLSRSDVVLIFDSPSSASRLGEIVKSESDSFLRLVRVYDQLNSSELTRTSHGLNRYLRRPAVGTEEKEPLWGKNKRTNSTRASYGSIVGFDASELDPETRRSRFQGSWVALAHLVL